MRIITDQNITEDLQSSNFWSTQYNYYFFGSKMPTISDFAHYGNLAPLVTLKSFVVNVTEEGVAILGLSLGGDLLPEAKTFISKDKIQSVRVSTNWISLGIAYNVLFTFTDNTTLKLQANRWTATIKLHGENIKKIKELY